MTIGLTDAQVRKEKPDREKRREVADAREPGLFLLVQPSGVKSWAVRYRRHGDGVSRKYTIGRYPAVSLAGARQRAHEVIQQAKDTKHPKDPAAIKQSETARQRERRVTGDLSFADTARKYIHRHRTLRSWREAARLIGLKPAPDDDTKLLAIEGGLVSRWGARPLNEIQKREIVDELDRLVDNGTPIVANCTLSALRRLWNWSMSRDDEIVRNPCNGIKPPTKEESRDRVLSDDEIRTFWCACVAIAAPDPDDARRGNSPFTAIFKLLLLTGQRRGEVAGMRWSEIDRNARTWIIPGERAKNGEKHMVPLSDAALAIIDSVPRIKDCDLLFTTNGNTVISGWSNAKEIIDAAMAKAGNPVTDWRLHDLRRCAASRMAELGVAPHVIEAVLNHRSGIISGVSAVYNRFDFASEKRDALDRLARDINRVVTGRVADVIRLPVG